MSEKISQIKFIFMIVLVFNAGGIAYLMGLVTPYTEIIILLAMIAMIVLSLLLDKRLVKYKSSENK